MPILPSAVLNIFVTDGCLGTENSGYRIQAIGLSSAIPTC